MHPDGVLECMPGYAVSCHDCLGAVALAVAALSTQLSTAALDKSPQSQERGITLDLGFSSCVVPLPDSLQGLWPCRCCPLSAQLNAACLTTTQCTADVQEEEQALQHAECQ